MPRRKQPQITRTAILRSAGAGFARNGYVGTGVGEIANAAGMTRGALFHHFPDKKRLALAWLEDELAPALRERCMVPLEAVAGFGEWKRACVAILEELDGMHPLALLNRLGMEWSAEPELADAVFRICGAWHEGLADVLGRGQSEGWIHRSIQPPDEASLMMAQWLGAALVRGASDGSLTAMVRAFSAYLETLRGEG